MQNITLVTAIAGLFFGVIGALLGAINTWRAFDRDRVRVRVVPVRLVYESGGEGFGIQVTNLSYFAITVNEIGFTTRGKDRRIIFVPSDIGGCELPQRMEPRTSFTARLPRGTTSFSQWPFIKKAQIATACGKQFVGTSDALRQKIKKARSKKET